MTFRESKAEILREYGPFESVSNVAGVTWDGESVWFADDGHVRNLDPKSGTLKRSLTVPADAGTAFDGKHLFQLAGNRIHRVDPETGTVSHTIPAPAEGQHSGMAWAEGKLWVAHYQSKRIFQIDPENGDILRTLETTKAVTGVTFVEGDMWHGTYEQDESDLRRIDPVTGEVLEAVALPAGVMVSGLESDGKDVFYCGGGRSKKVRAVKRPRRG